ncbi:MAG: hypothetical protein C0506_10830 [Anaerolinea sp.]|nr:hypothetical protein [Anaerolinea sp.]
MAPVTPPSASKSTPSVRSTPIPGTPTSATSILMSSPTAAKGWPFWAPTSAEEIERGLDLAALRPGERFVDLGCGDGRVLAAAARRGARVTGIEADPDRAVQARAAVAGFAGAEVIEGDFAELPFEAEVVYAYLSPALLRRLRPRLEGLAPGTRIVAVQYAVEGWQPAAAQGLCRFYRLPAARASPPALSGWEQAAVLLTLAPEQRILVPLYLVASPGRVSVHLEGELATGVDILTGAGSVNSFERVPVDVVFGKAAEGASATGQVIAENAGTAYAATLAVVRTSLRHGQWNVQKEGVATMLAAIAEVAAGRLQVPDLLKSITVNPERLSDG